MSHAGVPIASTGGPSACTVVERAGCSTSLNGATLTVQSEFCLRGEGEGQCIPTPDCSGGGFANCDSGTTLQDGTYTAKIGDLSVSFTIPSQLPFGGGCDGEPY